MTLLIDSTDPAVLPCIQAAEVLLARGREAGHAEPGGEDLQAFYFAGVSLINAAKMDPYRALNALGAVVGAACGLCEGPEGAVMIVADVARRYIKDTRQKAFLTDSEPQGRA